MAEHAAQPKTVDDELQLGDARTRVLHVHERVEHDELAASVLVVQQVDPICVHRYDDRGARDQDKGDERPAETHVVRVFRIVRLVLGNLALVHGHRAGHVLVQHGCPGHHASDGHGPREHRHDDRVLCGSAVAQRAYHFLRPRVVVQARQKQRRGNHRPGIVAQNHPRYRCAPGGRGHCDPL